VFFKQETKNGQSTQLLMFENLLGNLQKQQEELQQKLSEITVEAESGDGAVTVTATAALAIENIKLDASKLDFSDAEQLEDLLVVAVNRALESARQKAAAETGKLFEGLMPPGGLPGLPTP
jgi:DNA-binding YbaB/EbfC family protein